ncbi:MAG: hypothetical protein WBM41_04905 [Arenicellales bacterium]
MNLCSVAQREIWITSIVRNRVIYVEPGGQQTIIIEDADPEHLDNVDRAILNCCMDRPHFDRQYQVGHQCTGTILFECISNKK